MVRLQRFLSRINEIIDALDIDELNTLQAVLAEALVDELHEYLKTEFEEAYRQILDDEFDDDILFSSIYAEIGGETFEGRINRYVSESPTVDVLKQKIETLATTDGHRIQNEAKVIAGSELERSGFTVTKTWRSVKIPTTRDTHFGLDGITIPVTDYFETVNGKTLYPGGFFIAEEDVNCLCYLEINVK